MAFPQLTHLFAERLNNVKESSTQRVMIAAQRMKAEGLDVVDLGAGEPDFSTPPNIKEAAKKAIDADFTRYTAAVGVPELRDAVVGRFRRDFDVELLREEVMANVGGKQSIFNVLLALLNPGDEVLIPAPYWVTFPQAVQLCGGKPVTVETDPDDGFRLSVERVREYMTERTKLLIINSPSNPSGIVIPRAEFFSLCALAAEHEVYVLSDECYQRFIYDGLSPYSGVQVDPSIRPWMIVSGSLSKTYAMTGWRLGFTIAAAEIVAQIAKIQGHQTSNPTTISQAAGIEALTGSQDSVQKMMCEYQRRRDFLVPALNELAGVRCSNPQGAFYVFPDIRSCLGADFKDSDDFAARLLEDAHVAVTPGAGFGTDGFIRISYAAAYQDLEEAVRRISGFLTKHPCS